MSVIANTKHFFFTFGFNNQSAGVEDGEGEQLCVFTEFVLSRPSSGQKSLSAALNKSVRNTYCRGDFQIKISDP